MFLPDLWTWLGTLPISMHIAETWWFPRLESLHVIGSSFIVGSIRMVDLRRRGRAGRRVAGSRVIREILPRTYVALSVSIVAGVGLFLGRASYYVPNRAFQIKLVLLVLAGVNLAVFHLATARSLGRWDTVAETTAGAKAAGGCSLLLWSGIMLAGRWIGHLS
jgi:hypothetical protein